MKKKKIKPDRNPYAQGGAILIILGFIITAIGLNSYFYGTDEIVEGAQGIPGAPAPQPNNVTSVTILIQGIGLGITGIVLWIIGIIKKIRTSTWTLR
ncbi:hypothetical protein P4C99_21475 [Pontiellaceae bacterium B1224]|nr:hypothetical protein [Pontiellaceae bacterium B1224]